jgi:hypothetical protein
MEQKTMIRLLVGLGLGIPILIESVTFLGLVGHQFSNGTAGAETTTTGTGTTTDVGVGPGDELLPETNQSEELATAVIQGGTGGWTLTMTVQVDNPTNATHELRLGAITTSEGKTVSGGGSTGQIAPGETGPVTGRWDLPVGVTPKRVQVIAVTDPAGEASPETVSEQVTLEKVPVHNN